MGDNANRRGAVDLAMPLMVLAFMVIGGFLYWLNGEAAEQNALSIVEEAAPEEVVGIATTVAPADLQVDATLFEGQLIRVAGLTVSSILGTQGFWLGLPNGNPFLVSLSEEAMAEGVQVVQGEIASVTGTLLVRTDSALDVWVAAGTIGDGDRLVAEFALHYLDVTEVVVAQTEAADSTGNND